MEKLIFSKRELLTNLMISKMQPSHEYPVSVKLVNKSVRIILILDSPTNITLYGYHKSEGESRKGIARCALYFLLSELVTKGLITMKQVVHVSSPTPSDGNKQRLVNIYKDMGFSLHEPIAGTPINLNAQVKDLITTLNRQCESTTSYNTFRNMWSGMRRRMNSLFWAGTRKNKKSRRRFQRR